jgi:hypothetical protein
MAQQTALETFWEQIAEILPFSVDSETAIKLYEKYQEAKQMEKEQIMEAYVDGYESQAWVVNAERYYTQTYGTRLQNETN